MTGPADFEKLGAFYLGKIVDPGTRQATDEPVLLDSRHLTTHAVVVGMTGSGKTGLGIALLEEAAIDGVPAIVIDPKGDLGNLLLTFPSLAPSDFAPWVDETEAARQGLSREQVGERVAAAWREGLAQWGQDGERIARLRAAADVAIYTPGSSAGLSLSVVRSFSAPSSQVAADPDALRERVAAAASGLLGLLGLNADPLTSREHVLVATILDAAWRDGRSLDMAGLVREIQSPPFQQVGVMDLESFFPARDRFGLAMQVNGLLASPSFASWLAGEPLDVARLLWTPEGRPRIAVLSIAHLSDAERMFFVTLLMSEIVAWMRSQPGTGSLRALVYMDEVFGYLPPVASPPSKKPMLTLLKQARACGLGVVLATQNPVDLDYKALSNAGTWIIGRLQAERDVARVIDGLEGASAAAGKSFDRQAMETLISGLSKRMFLVNDVHEDAPFLMQSRWTLSYLAGPMTRQQVQRLVAERKAAGAQAAAAQVAGPAPASAPGGSALSPGPAPVSVGVGAGGRPVLPPDISEVFVSARRGPEALPGTIPAYRPALLARARLHHVSAKDGVDAWRDVTLLADIPESGDPAWDEASVVELADLALSREPEPGLGFAPLPSGAAQARQLTAWARSLAGHLHQTASLTLLRCASPRASSQPGETEGEFRARLAFTVKELRDGQLDQLRAKLLPKLDRIDQRILAAEARVRRERGQYSTQSAQAAISFGAALLGVLSGRRGVSSHLGRATTALRGTARAAQQRGDIGEAQESVEALRQQRAEIEEEARAQAETLFLRLDPESIAIESFAVPARKADITVAPLAIAWLPG